MTQFCRIVLTVGVLHDERHRALDRPRKRPPRSWSPPSRPPQPSAWRLDALGDSLDFNDYGRDLPPQTYDPTWPFRTTTPPTFSPYRTRLDGSSVFDPPTVYGLPTYGYGRRHAPVYDGYHFAPAVPNGYGFSRRVHPGVSEAGRAPVRRFETRAGSRPPSRGPTVSTTALGAGRPYPRPIQPAPRR